MQNKPANSNLLKHIFLGTDAETGKYSSDPVGIHAYLDAPPGSKLGAFLPPDVKPIGFLGDFDKVHIMVWQRLRPDKNGELTDKSNLKASTMLPLGMPMTNAAQFFLDPHNESMEKPGKTRYPTVDPAYFAAILGMDEDADKHEVDVTIENLIKHPDRIKEQTAYRPI